MPARRRRRAGHRPAGTPSAADRDRHARGPPRPPRRLCHRHFVVGRRWRSAAAASNRQRRRLATVNFADLDMQQAGRRALGRPDRAAPAGSTLEAVAHEGLAFGALQLLVAGILVAGLHLHLLLAASVALGHWLGVGHGILFAFLHEARLGGTGELLVGGLGFAAGRDVGFLLVRLGRRRGGGFGFGLLVCRGGRTLG